MPEIVKPQIRHPQLLAEVVPDLVDVHIGVPLPACRLEYIDVLPSFLGLFLLDTFQDTDGRIIQRNAPSLLALLLTTQQ